MLELTRVNFSRFSFTFIVVAPDVFYVDHEETVSVTVFNVTSAVVELHLRNEPVETSIFSRVTVNAQPGKRGKGFCKV